LYIIWVCENKLSLENGLKVEFLGMKQASAFNEAKLAEVIVKTANDFSLE